MNVEAIAQGVAAALSNLGIRVYDHGPDAPTPPCAYLYPENILFDATFDGTERPRFVISLLAQSVDTKGGQAQLNKLISTGVTGSLIDALHADPTLGGAVASSAPTQVRNYGTRTAAVGDVRYWTAEIVLDIYS